MANPSTIVITYTAATAAKGVSVDSFTVDGSAYAALNDTEKKLAYGLFKAGMAAMLRDAKMPSAGTGDQDVALQ